jgi:hypothetical protein
MEKRKPTGAVLPNDGESGALDGFQNARPSAIYRVKVVLPVPKSPTSATMTRASVPWQGQDQMPWFLFVFDVDGSHGFLFPPGTVNPPGRFYLCKKREIRLYSRKVIMEFAPALTRLNPMMNGSSP